MIYGNYIGRNKYEVTHTLDGGNFSSVPWVSGLINGKGRYIDKTTGKLRNVFPKKSFVLILISLLYASIMRLSKLNVSIHP